MQVCKGFEPLTCAIPRGAALYQFNQQANWEQVIEIVRYNP